MKYIKSKNLILVILTVLLLVSSSFVSFGTSINTVNDRKIVKITDFKIRSSSVAIKLDTQKIGTTNLNIDSKDDKILDIESFNDSKNIVIANTIHHEYHPSMVVNGRDCLVAYERENEGNTYIYLSNSSDYGQNWTDDPLKLNLLEVGDELLVNSPSLCIEPFENQAYGVFLSSLINTGVIGALIIPDISDIKNEIISYFVLNFSIIPDGPGEYSSFWDFSCPDIVFHDKTNVPWIISYTGTTNFTNENGDYSSKDSLMFLYQDESNPNTVWLQWDHTIENCANLSLATDEESKKFYGICEKRNASNQDLLFFKGTYEQSGNEDPYLDIIYNNISSNMSHKHPSIFVKDDDIYVVTETNINGTSQDIIIYYSSDEGENWDEIDPTGNVSVPPGEFIPKLPLISANSTDIICTYIEDKNLYLTQSNNLGVNWSVPVRINNANNTVVDKYRYADIPDTKHIVWTDNRAANLDLYSISYGVPRLNLMIVPGSLILNATKNPYFSTNNSVKFKVKNTGEDFAEDVLIEITINRTDKGPYTTKYPGFIKYLKTGAEIELTQPLFEMTLKGYVYAVSDLSEIDYINVTIIPSSSFQDSDPSDNIESIPVTFDKIFPLLSQHPILVALFKLLALVL